MLENPQIAHTSNSTWIKSIERKSIHCVEQCMAHGKEYGKKNPYILNEVYSNSNECHTLSQRESIYIYILCGG